ncbi:TetR/AcrR family transcriptional regulator [Nocardia vinacea]|uniref:TetR/AcrR family transcriptional regulator n=1 Tax=Nocardia vinacea TaxID=96468 RepID=UPI002E15ABFF|nr:TetR/AcrR family transcriptional regulator [Nocardia vinacea]
MSDVKPQRLDYVEQTRQALVDAAERLFAENGYHRTSLDAVGAAARFTKGAVYRHFKDKQSLFEAVFIRVQTDTATTLLTDIPITDDAWQWGLNAIAKYLQACTQTRYRRIVLEEGPAVLGWSKWRELDQQYAGHLLEQVLTELMNKQVLPHYPAHLLARLCCALIGEAALTIADTDTDTTREQTLAILTKLLTGLRGDCRKDGGSDLGPMS